MNHPLVTLPADDIAAVIIFLTIAVFLVVALIVNEVFASDKPKRRR